MKTARSTVLGLLSMLVLIFFSAACQRATDNGRVPTINPSQLSALKWEELELLPRGTAVTFAMWSGDEARNRYFRGAVTEEMRRRFGIELRIVPLGDAAEAVSKLLNEKAVGKQQGGSIDMVWINGENFGSAKQGAVLWVHLLKHFQTTTVTPLQPTSGILDHQSKGLRPPGNGHVL